MRVSWLIVLALLIPLTLSAMSWTGHFAGSEVDMSRSLTFDMDGDGDYDIVTSTSTANLTWWENVDGTGLVWTSHEMENVLGRNMAWADMDEDGDPDLVTMTSTIRWYENEDGVGDAWVEHEVSEYSGGGEVYIADMDGDGDLDLLSSTSSVFEANVIAWWENTDGGGTSWAQHGILEGEVDSFPSIEPVDIDNDGDVDVVLGMEDVSVQLSWFENVNGSGTSWTSNAVVTSAVKTGYVTAADMDDDGDRDLIAYGEYSPGDYGIMWWENSSNGTSWSGHDVGLAGASYPSDIDNDGDMDIVASYSVWGELKWFENTDGAGTMLEHYVDDDHEGVWYPQVADLDGDGFKDIVATSFASDALYWWEQTNVTPELQLSMAEFAVDWTEGNPAPTRIFSVQNVGIGTLEWTAEEEIDWISIEPVSGSLTQGEIQQVYITFESFPGDGVFTGAIDILAPGAQPSSAAVNITLSTTVPWVTTPVDLSFSTAGEAHSADMDQDGDLDVVGMSWVANQIIWWENADGTGMNWSSHLVANIQNGRGLFVADLDGDSDLDIVSMQSDLDGVYWYENDGFWTEHLIGDQVETPSQVHVADLDGDGDMDVLGTSRGDQEVIWWENSAGNASAWTEHVLTTGHEGVYHVHAGDLDGDGDMDVVAGAGTYNVIRWWSNDNGDASAWTERTVTSDYFSPSSLHIADINGDGDNDILCATYSEPVWLENADGMGTSWTAIELESGFEPAVIGAADFENDGDLDIYAGSFDTGNVAWWINIDGAGETMVKKQVIEGISGLRDLRVGDVDGDDDPDLFYAWNSGISWLQQPGSGTAVGETPQNAARPTAFTVGKGYPNPFNPSISVPFTLPASGEVQLALYNVQGRRVMAERASFNAGRHLHTIEARPGMTSGMYFLQVQFNGQSAVQRVILMK